MAFSWITGKGSPQSLEAAIVVYKSAERNIPVKIADIARNELLLFSYIIGGCNADEKMDGGRGRISQS